MPAQQRENDHLWSRATAGEDVEQLLSAALPPRGSFGALLRAGRQRALLSQEQLAARAELSERTVRNHEVGQVRSPRADHRLGMRSWPGSS